MLDILFSYVLCTVVALFISPIIFMLLRRLKTGQNILHYVDNHASKQGTLSMGGIIFVLSSLFSIIFLKNNKILAFLILCITFCYALVGFLDDFLKVKFKHNEGLKPYQKIIGQVGIAIIVSTFVYKFSPLGSNIAIPFTNLEMDIGWLIIPFVIIFFIAVTNSVNLTDGLDGLAGYISLIVIFTLGIISLIKGGVENVNGVNINILSQYQNIAVVCFGMGGALGVFLIFNCHPAKIFMGDTGSLALGAFIASVGVFLKEYILIAIIGIVFVLTTISDIIQVGVYKIKKKRVFLMAPFHHHLERKGMVETKIVGIYTFITLFVCIITIIIYYNNYLKLL